MVTDDTVVGHFRKEPGLHATLMRWASEDVLPPDPGVATAEDGDAQLVSVFS